MIAKHRARLSGLFILSDVLAIVLSFLYTYLFRFYAYILPVDPVKGVPRIGSYLILLPIFLAAHLGVFYLQGFYKARLRRTKLEDFVYICLNSLLSVMIVLGLLSYFNAYTQGAAPLFRFNLIKLSHVFLAIYAVAVVFTISFFRNQIYYFMNRRYARGQNLQNVLIVGAGEQGRTVAQKLIEYKDLGFVIKGFLDDDRPVGEMIVVDGGLPVLGRAADIGAVIEAQAIQEVYVALSLANYAEIVETLQIVNKYPVNVRIVPDLFQLLTLKAMVHDLDGFPVISIDEVPLQGAAKMVKRSMDIGVSGLSLLLLSPVFLIVAVLIKLTSRGPVFYHQERVGNDGRRFRIHKFRTMICNAETNGPQMCQPDDPRMTRIGRFLRKYSIDEVPQLVNIFRGEMSLVGPRAERPEFVKEFTEAIPKYMLRHKVRAGLTGWAQVHGLRQDTSIEKRLEYDFFYIQNWSLLFDLKILWKTLRGGFIDKSVK
ncbi:MAG: undecaprenyl-phosphate glucose phosphotransferase [Candidatus Aminicenantes bacterium]|nr:undecaprenyl-phosphate glucose phosphotransferase [Candidatus Aminicenantes bacterium]